MKRYLFLCLLFYCAITHAADEGLLGPWLLEHHPETVLAYDDNFDNQGIHIYQIEVQTQQRGDCWIHAFRNCLYIIDGILSPREKFSSIYDHMVSRKQYKAFMKHGCPKKGNEYQLIREQLACRPDCIPQNSPSYVKKITRFGYTNNFKKIDQQAMQEQLVMVENNDDAEDVFDALLLADNNYPPTYERCKKFFHALHEHDDYLFAIELDIAAINHAVALIVHKDQGQIEYFYADSNNVLLQDARKISGRQKYSYDHGEQEIALALSKLIELIRAPQLFDDALVRALYDRMVNPQKIRAELKLNQTMLYAVEDFYEQLKELKLLKNNLYAQAYAPAYCDYISALKDALGLKPSKFEAFDEEFYEDLMQTVGCS